MSVYPDLINELRKRGLRIIDWDFLDDGSGWIKVSCGKLPIRVCSESVREVKRALSWYGSDLGRVAILLKVEKRL